MIERLAQSLGVMPDAPSFWLPLVFMAALVVIIVGGVILDGFDIGVGLLLGVAPPGERDRMIMLLNPWRDANEFWLLLGAGLFIAAFPFAWGDILAQLYAPLVLMLCGTVMRSVSAEFRLRSPAAVRPRWIVAFWAGSLMCAFSHGVLLTHIVTAYQDPPGQIWFDLFMGVCAVFAYVLLGASWLIMRVRGSLQARATNWARYSVRWTAAGMVAVAVTLALSNAGILYKWAQPSELESVVSLWVLMLVCFVGIELALGRLPTSRHEWLAALPFACCVMLFLTMLLGLAYGLFPYLILDVTTIWDAAADVASLQLVLAAAVVAAPVLLLFNILAYRSVFGREGVLDEPPGLTSGKRVTAAKPPPGA